MTCCGLDYLWECIAATLSELFISWMLPEAHPLSTHIDQVYEDNRKVDLTVSNLYERRRFQ